MAISISGNLIPLEALYLEGHFPQIVIYCQPGLTDIASINLQHEILTLFQVCQRNIPDHLHLFPCVGIVQGLRQHETVSGLHLSC